MTGGHRREAVFDPSFLEDLTYWTRADRKLALRVLRLVEAILRDSFGGIGKPEPLRGELAGRCHAGSTSNTAWSTRSPMTGSTSLLRGIATERCSVSLPLFPPNHPTRYSPRCKLSETRPIRLEPMK